MSTGRTSGKFIKVQIDDVNGTVRDVPVATISGIGVTADVVDLTALQDALTGGLTGVPTFESPITGPFDTRAAVSASGTGAAPALSGSHTVLEPINNGSTPLTLGIYIGIQANWTTGGDPVFGITSSATAGVLLRDYTVSDDGMYSATIYMFPGSTAVDWATSAFT